MIEHTGLKVSCFYIARVKAKHGLIERECHDKAKPENAKVLQCPPDKERAIEEALSHFRFDYKYGFENAVLDKWNKYKGE